MTHDSATFNHPAFNEIFGNANGSRFPNRPLLTALCQAAVRKMPIFNAQHMANMTWAMATLAHKATNTGI